MTTNPPEARRAPIKQDVLDRLEETDKLVDRLSDGTDSIRPKNVLDKGDEPPDYETVVLVGVEGESSESRSARMVDADYLVQILVLRSDTHRRTSSALWTDHVHDAIASALTHFSAGDSIGNGQFGGVEEEWSEQRNRWMSDKSFVYSA